MQRTETFIHENTIQKVHTKRIEKPNKQIANNVVLA